MSTLSPAVRKYLRGLAHHLEPVVRLGKNGVTDQFLGELNQALDAHELIKLKFISFKEDKKTLAQEIAEKSRSELAGMIGNIAILYRQHYDQDKRKIHIPDELR
jgi:RNA-binding protein